MDLFSIYFSVVVQLIIYEARCANTNPFPFNQSLICFGLTKHFNHFFCLLVKKKLSSLHCLHGDKMLENRNVFNENTREFVDSIRSDFKWKCRRESSVEWWKRIWLSYETNGKSTARKLCWAKLCSLSAPRNGFGCRHFCKSVIHCKQFYRADTFD